MSEVLNHIDKNGKVPLYYQLKEILLSEIEKKESDEMIEPESALIARYGVSRTTVRQAIAELIKDNYLYTIRGKGTFVAERKVGLEYMNKIESYSDQVLKSGLTPKTETLELKIVLADKDIANALKVEVGQGVLLLKRLRYANLIPLAITESYLPLPLCAPLAEKDLGNDSLYEYLDKELGAKVVHVHRIIKAGIANKDDSKLLEIDEGTPLQYFINIASTREGTPVEYCRSRFRVDMIAFTVDLHI